MKVGNFKILLSGIGILAVVGLIFIFGVRKPITQNYTAEELYEAAVKDMKTGAEENVYRALSNLERAIKINPQYSDAYHLLGQSYLQLSLENARRILERGLKYLPNDKYINFLMLQLLVREEKNKEILLLVNKLQKNYEFNRGQLSLVFHSKGMAEINLRMTQEGLASLTKAKELLDSLNDVDPVLYNDLGYAYFLNNDFGNAEKYYLLAIESDKKLVRAYNNLGEMYKKMGDNEKALKYFNESLMIEPDQEGVKKRIEELSVTG